MLPRMKCRSPLGMSLALLLITAPAVAHDSMPAVPAPFAKSPAATSSSPKPLTIPHTKHVLSNGLTVILHVDNRQPLVTVNVSYNVGSRCEEPGKTGFAHLFEHLMFMGTRRVPTKMFDGWMENAGGYNNAWTSEDRTDYFDVGPSAALPLLLWLEADRLRDLGPLMTLDKLNAQRDVVKNERRQSYENRPYGKADLLMPELFYPTGHPYHHPVIGSHADLQAASVDDAKNFFAKWYDPANASLVVAGDFAPEPTLALIRRWFESVPSRGKPVDDSAARAAGKSLPSDVVHEATDDVELNRVTIALASPKHFATGDADLDLASAILSDGKGSRLYRKLVVELGLASDVSVHQNSGTLESRFETEVMLREKASFAQVEKVVLDELAALAQVGPKLEELQRAQAGYETSFVTRLEGLRERASLLNMYQAELGVPDGIEKDLARYRGVTIESVKRALSEALRKPKVTLRVSKKSKSQAKPEAVKKVDIVQ
jgi:zinc protease